MHILHVINAAETGGAETLVEALMRASDSETTMHLLVLMGPGDLSARLEAAADSVTYVNMRRRDVVPFRAMFVLYQLVRRKHVDVVHSHLHQSDLINLVTPHGRRRLSTLHTSADLASHPVARIAWRSAAALSFRFDAVVACSRSAQAFARQMGYRFNPDRMLVIYNGAALSTAPNLVNDSQTFLHIGRHVAAKDHSTLFRAFAHVAKRFPEARLRCAGPDIQASNSSLMAQIDELGLRDHVDLLGQINTVRDEIRKATAVVFSSCHEAMPMAGIEAIGEGTPVLTTDAGDTPALVVAPQAVVPVRDEAALADAMSWWLSLDPEEQAHLRRLSWQHAVDDFDIRQTAAKYAGLYRSLMTAK